MALLSVVPLFVNIMLITTAIAVVAGILDERDEMRKERGEK
jgi:Kef-type K+ transport system membrane component KefB